MIYRFVALAQAHSKPDNIRPTGICSPDKMNRMRSDYRIEVVNCNDLYITNTYMNLS